MPKSLLKFRKQKKAASIVLTAAMLANSTAFTFANEVEEGTEEVKAQQELVVEEEQLEEAEEAEEVVEESQDTVEETEEVVEETPVAVASQEEDEVEAQAKKVENKLDAKKAQAAGISEGASIIKTLENLGYYD